MTVTCAPFSPAPVAFDWAYFQLRYPELAGSINAVLGGVYFTEAGLYCDNTASSPIADNTVGGVRYLLLHMVTAHICALNAALNGSPSSTLVGRISNATQGSVSVGSEMGGKEVGGKDWFMQTKYGAAFWQASAQYRMMRYAPGPVRVTDPWPWGSAGYSPYSGEWY